MFIELPDLPQPLRWAVWSTERLYSVRDGGYGLISVVEVPGGWEVVSNFGGAKRSSHVLLAEALEDVRARLPEVLKAYRAAKEARG